MPCFQTANKLFGVKSRSEPVSFQIDYAVCD